MEPECDGSEIVVRFSPFAADRLKENAEDTYADDLEKERVPARYGVSVLAAVCEPGETIVDTVTRLCNETKLGGKRVAVTTGKALREAGFSLQADPTKEEKHHYLVGEGSFQTVLKVDLLASILDLGRMNNPAWMKGTVA